MNGTSIRRTARRGAAAVSALALCVGAIAEASSGSGGPGSGKIDDKIDAAVESKVEDKAAEKVDDRSSGKIEDKIEAEAEDKAGGAVDQKIDDRVADKIDDRAAGAAVDKAEDKAGGKALDRIDRSGSGKFERASASAAENKAAERAAKDALDAAQRALDLAHKAELDAAKANFERALASGVDPDAAKSAYDAAKDRSDVAYDQARDAATRADYAASRTDDGSGSGSSGDGSSGSPSAGGSSGSGSSGSGSSGDGGRGSSGGSGCGGDDCAQGSAATAQFPAFEGERDDRGAVRARGELLLLAAPGDARGLTDAGYDVFEADDLPALDAVLLRVRAGAAQRLEDAETILRKAAPAAAVDFNHVYAPSASAPSAASTKAATPAALMRIAGATQSRIGVVDSHVDMTHEALAGADVVTADFVGYRDPRPSDHGTGVVSILAGRSATFEGVAAGAKVFEASVFFQPSAGGASATAASIVRAMDWLAAQDVSVVNLSLAGPPNEILKGAIERVQRRGVVVVAAVGNDGPAAPPLYPAAYDGVVGVTAVGRDKRVFRLAGRGAQVDFAAPGVDILHAGASGRYEASSGTSMAAPFVSAALAAAAARLPHGTTVEALERRAEDLGAEGRDPVFGWGLVRPLTP